MKKQTAVEFLVNYMKENFHLTDESLEKFEQAKEMEKEQIEWAYLQAYNDCLLGRLSDSENYYQHHYGI